MFNYTADVQSDCAKLRAIAQTSGLCGLDFETTVAPAYLREVCTIQLTHANGAEAIAYVYPDGEKWVRYVFENAKATFCAHNSTFEAECCVKAGILVYPYCTMIAAKVLRGRMEGDKTHRMGWSLKDVMKREFDKDRDKTVRDRDWRDPPDAEALEYALEDTRDTLNLWQKWETLFAAEPDQWRGYTILQDAMPAMVECNLHGLPFNPDAHLVLIANLTQQMAEHEFMLDLLCWGQITNHGSTQQVAAWMRRIMLAGRPVEQIVSPTAFSLIYQQCTGTHWPLTDTGQMSLDRGAVETRLPSLTKVAPDVAAYLVQRLQWSKVAKLKQAFGESLRQFVGDDGYARSSTRIHGAQTSRASANSFNHQQMPSEPEFRALFKAKPGRKLVIADYSQIELRVAAIETNETTMLGVFQRKDDIHQATADYIKRLMTGDQSVVASKKERKDGKAVTFSVVYYAQAPTVAVAAGLPLHEAEVLLDTWLSVYPQIKVYRDTAFDKAKEIGGLRLVSGQFLRLADDTRPAMVVNSKIQGSAASVMYRAMYLVHLAVAEARAAGADIWLCAPVHDELILDAADVDAPLAADLLQTAMRQALLDLYPDAADLGMRESADSLIVTSWDEKDKDRPGETAHPEVQARIRAELLALKEERDWERLVA